MPHLLDIGLISLGLLAGVGAFLGGSDSLYKLFLGLIIAFLAYLVLSYQIEIAQLINQELLNSYQVFLLDRSDTLLTMALLMIPVLGMFFMLHPRIRIMTRKNSPSQLLLGLILPVFLIGILSFLAQGSILKESSMWQRVFDFFALSNIFALFEKFPWFLFALLVFLIFYKAIFLLFAALLGWLYESLIMSFFTGWSEERKAMIAGGGAGDYDEEDEEDFI